MLYRYKIFSLIHSLIHSSVSQLHEQGPGNRTAKSFDRAISLDGIVPFAIVTPLRHGHDKVTASIRQANTYAELFKRRMFFAHQHKH